MRTLHLKDDKLYSSADDGNVVVWDLSTGAILARIRNPAPDQCQVSLFYENSIFYGCRDNSIRRLDLATNRFITGYFGHKRPVTGLAIIGGFLYSAAIDDSEKSVRKFDIFTAQQNPNSIYYLSNTNALTTFNDFLVCGCDDGSIVVWNTISGQRQDLITGIVSKPISFLTYYSGFLYASSDAKLARFKWEDNKFAFDRFLDVSGSEIMSTTTFGTRIFTGDSGTIINRYNMLSGWYLGFYYSQRKKLRTMVLGKDGFIFTGADDYLIRKWNPVSYELERILTGHTSYVVSLFFDSVYNNFYSSGSDGKIILWNTDTGDILRTINISGGFANVVKIYKGVLYAAISNGVVSCWSLQTGSLIRSLSMSGAVTGLDINDQYIVAGDANRFIRVFSTETGVIVQEYNIAGFYPVMNIILREGHFLLTADGSVWSNNFSEQFTIILKGSEHIGSMVVVEGYAIIIGLLGGAIRVLDLNNNYQLMYSFEGHTNSVTSLSVEGSFLYSSSMDGSVRKWDFTTSNLVKVMEDSNSASTSLVAYNGTVLVGQVDGSVNAFDSKTAKIKANFVKPETQISFLSYHNQTVYSLSLDGKIQRHNAEDFSMVNEISLKDSRFSSFHVGDSGIFAASLNKTILWYANDSVPVVALQGFNSTIASMASSGKYLFTGGESNSILVWDLRQSKIILALTGHEGVVTCLLKHDGSLYSGSEDNTIIRWDDTFHIVRIFRRTFTMPGHTGPIRAIAATQNVLFSAGDDKMIKQWQIDSGRIMDTFEGHSGKINALVFHNSSLFSASNDGSVLVWNPVIPQQALRSTIPVVTSSSLRRDTIVPRDRGITDFQNSRLSDLAIAISAVAGSLILIMFVCVWRYSRYIIDRDSSKNTSTSHNRKTSAVMDPEGTLVATHLGAAKPAYLEVDPTGFRLRKKVGKGGAGSIYLAEILHGSSIELAEDNDIIVKVIYADYNTCSPSQQQTFDQEITIMTMLQEFRNIARIVGYCHVPCCILMKYYLYGSLDTWIYKKRLLRYSHKMVAHFMLDISRGLMCMHARWLIHCDIKPQNVLIDRDEANGIYFCVLTDFGITNIVSDKVLAAKTFKVANLRGMSSRYAAPECFKRFRERKNDSPKVMAAGDIFAFSILLLECLTRKMPWKESKTESEASSGFSSQKKSESSQA